MSDAMNDETKGGAREVDPAVQQMQRHALTMTIAQVIQNRSNGCLNVAWSRAVAADVLTQIETAFALVLKPPGEGE